METDRRKYNAMRAELEAVANSVYAEDEGFAVDASLALVVIARALVDIAETLDKIRENGVGQEATAPEPSE